MSTTDERLDYWNDKLNDATALVAAIEYAKTCGLDVEFAMTFIEHLESGQYNVAESIFHSLREWDL